MFASRGVLVVEPLQPTNESNNMINANATLITIFLAAFSFAGLATAADWHTSGGLVITHQSTNEYHINNETEASTDLIINRQTEAGQWLGHIEASTTPNVKMVSGILPEANSDVGSALDKDNEGRVQLSELYYNYEFNANQVITTGLLDVSGFFEQSRIASDETTQFLGASFTGNPSIEFPDYTLGLIYEHTLETGSVLRAAIANSNGIADNTERSYSQLLSVEDDNKGLFAIASGSWKSNTWLLRVGAWANTADHESIDGKSNSLSNYGSYLLAGYRLGKHAFNMRLGLANQEVSQASGFTSIGYQFKQGDYVMGAGVARAFLSAKEPNRALGDTAHYEVYVRYALTRRVFLTGDVQHIVNSNFGVLNENRDEGITVYGFRLSYLFESVLSVHGSS